MGAIRRLAVGVAMTGAASALVFPLAEGNNGGPSPTVAEARADVDLAQKELRVADHERAATISLIGQKCADATYPHTVNQKYAYLDTEDFAAVITTGESEPCGRDLDVVERKVRMMDEAFSSLNTANRSLDSTKADLKAAQQWKKKDKLDEEIRQAGEVAVIGLSISGLVAWFGRRKKSKTITALELVEQG